MTLVCVQCALRAMLAGLPQPSFDETVEEHVARVHPDQVATQVERKDLLSQAKELRHFVNYDVLVPLPGTSAERTIDRGSGIVGVPGTTGTVLVYFEGNRFGSESLRTLEARVGCAAGRMSSRYPTIARAVFPRADFRVVGSYRFRADWQGPQTFTILPGEEPLVQAWERA